MKLLPRLRKFVAMASGLVFMILRFISPRRNHAFVAGMTPDEGNAAEMVRALLSRYEGTIWWLDPPSLALRTTLGVADEARIVLVCRRWRPSVIAAYLTAELVFSTHGLFGMPSTPRRKPVIDVWHGEQAKGGGRLYPFRRLPGQPATYLLAASNLLAGEKLARAGMHRSQLIWAPNPRVDQLKRPAADDLLDRLGIDAARPFVVWMPTFRQGKQSLRDSAWVNTTDPHLDRRLGDLLSTLIIEALENVSVQLVVKPHPLDLVAREVRGAIVVSSEQLNDAGVPLYALLGRSSGLITDYSSVWIDYLAANRPIAFYMPDKSAYEGGRGSLPSRAYEVLPGPVLESAVDVHQFVDDVLTEGALSASSRRAAIDHLGLRVVSEAADLVLDEVWQRSPLRFARTKRTRGIESGKSGGLRTGNARAGHDNERQSE